MRPPAQGAHPGTIPVHTSRDEPTTCVDAEPFALQVTDDSMAPEFPRGCVVIVDPTGVPAHGAFVVADSPAGPLLRQLALAPGGWRLQALAVGPDSEAAPVRPEQLRGVVVQRAGRRRRDHKHYR